ncbi:hypothetical protein HanIR_Chr08g0349191 [Helianthus annuus]|nr:hypothetical protein HanIR_Chr08g0349191 [Helianthus annuus]
MLLVHVPKVLGTVNRPNIPVLLYRTSTELKVLILVMARYSSVLVRVSVTVTGTIDSSLHQNPQFKLHKTKLPVNGTARISPSSTSAFPNALTPIRSVTVVLYLAAIPAKVSTGFTTYDK